MIRRGGYFAMPDGPELLFQRRPGFERLAWRPTEPAERMLFVSSHTRSG